MEMFDSGSSVPAYGNADLSQKAAFFGKWLYIYFWVELVPVILGLVLAVAELAGYGGWLEELVSFVLAGITIAVLYILGRREDKFRTCAGLNLIVFVVSAVVNLIGSEFLTKLWAVPEGVLQLMVLYYFMHGCREILLGIDNDLADKWHKLWKWYIGLLIGMLVLFLPMTIVAAVLKNGIITFLYGILVLAVGVGLLAVVIMELVYLYRTANTFRRISEAIARRGPEPFV